MSADLETLPETLGIGTLEEIRSSHMPTPKAIDISFFSNRLRKSTQLIGNKYEENFIKARREWMAFDFTELLYVSTIEVFASGYEQYHELEISFTDFISGNTIDRSVKYNNGSFLFSLNMFVGGFGLRPTERLIRDSRITRIDVVGIEQRRVGDVLAVMANLNAEVDAAEQHLERYLVRAKGADERYAATSAKLAKIEAEITQKDRELAGLTGEVMAEVVKLDEAKKQLAINESVNRNVEAQVQDASRRLESLNSRSNTLSQDNEEKEARLRALQNDINLFPTEISGYVTQGAKNVKLYAWLCAIPLAVIVFVTYRLFLNSEKILNYSVFGGRSVLEFLISRLPYVVVSFAILAVCYTLLNRLVSEVIGINRRRQDLFKISIIATDVSYASQHGLEVSDEEAYNLRTETKMELLKEHLRQHIGDEFVYNPKGNLFHKLSKLASRQIDDEGDTTSDATLVT